MHEVFPWPDDPQSVFSKENRKDISAKWLGSRHNDGNGSRAMNVQNFHWKVKNAYDLESLLEFKGHIGRLDQGDWNILAIFRAPDGYDFCPGADLKKLYNRDLAYSREFFKQCQETCYLTATMQTPAFFCMQGRTMGLGAGLTAHSVFRIATETAVWSMPNVLYGAFPDCGMTWVMPRLEGEVGMFLALTGKRVENTDCNKIGLATHFIPVEDICAFEQESANIMTNELSDMFTWLNAYLKPIPKASAIMNNIDVINRIFGSDTLGEIFEKLEAEGTIWSKNILKRMRDCSPLMLHVTFRLQKIGRYLNSLEDAFELEYRVAQNMIEHSADFYEGIRARIMEPGSVPNWTHASHKHVTDAEIARFFDPALDTLKLKACRPAKRPEKDPYSIYIPEVESYLHSEFSTHLLMRMLPEDPTIDDIKEYYTMLLEEKDFHHIAADYYYTKEKYDEFMIEEIDKDYVLHDRKDVFELDRMDELQHEKKRDYDEDALQKAFYIPQMSYTTHGKQKE